MPVGYYGGRSSEQVIEGRIVSDDKPPKSPASKTIRTAIAAIFVGIWLILLIADFFLYADADVIPLWFQVTGLLVLGFLLGLSMDDIPGRGK